jgi:diacylglycerol kinase (ATP)
VNRIGIVINPTSGRGRGSATGEAAIAALTGHGFDVHDLSGADIRRATDQARQGVVDGLDALVVVGGDGMVHLGANVVAGTSLPLGIVAAGSGNDLARTLGLPIHDTSAAVGVIARAMTTGPRSIDAVSVHAPEHAAREWFVGVLSAGLDAAVNARANVLTWPSGRGRYVRALASELRTFRPYGYRLLIDDELWISSGTLVCVANAPSFGGGMHIAPDARIDDGLLDVVLVGPINRGEVARVFPRVYRGRHVSHPAVTILRGRDVVLEPHTVGPHPMPPHAFADGEPVGPLPLHCSVQPGAVKVLAPTPARPTDRAR